MGFLKKLFGTREQPAQQPTQPTAVSREHNVTAIAQTLKRIQSEGGQGNFCIFIADADKNYYIQFAARANDAALYAEVVGNQVLKSDAKLTESQHQQLLAAGWHKQSFEVHGNYSREWTAFDDADRLSIAEAVMHTLTRIYGVPSDRTIDVNLELQ